MLNVENTVGTVYPHSTSSYNTVHTKQIYTWNQHFTYDNWSYRQLGSSWLALGWVTIQVFNVEAVAEKRDPRYMGKEAKQSLSSI